MSYTCHNHIVGPIKCHSHCSWCIREIMYALHLLKLYFQLQNFCLTRRIHFIDFSRRNYSFIKATAISILIRTRILHFSTIIRMQSSISFLLVSDVKYHQIHFRIVDLQIKSQVENYYWKFQFQYINFPFGQCTGTINRAINTKTSIILRVNICSISIYIFFNRAICAMYVRDRKSRSQ